MTRTVEVLADGELYEVTRVVDGDTLLGRRLHLTGCDDDDETLTRDRRPRRLRLTLVQAPEVKGDTLAEGLRYRLLLLGWLDARRGHLRVRSYAADGFGRILVDVYDPRTGDTASAALLADGCPLYVR